MITTFCPRVCYEFCQPRRTNSGRDALSRCPIGSILINHFASAQSIDDFCKTTRLLESPAKHCSIHRNLISCGEPGNNSARSKICENHKLTIDEKERLVLGDKREHFVRRIPISSIVRQQYQTQLQQKITELSAHIREIVTRAQVFVNGYIIDHASQPIPSYLY